GSDGSWEALRRAEDLPNFRLEYHPSSGIGEARQRALSRASGEIVGIIDQDNLLYPDALSRAADLFSRRPGTAAVYSAQDLVDEAGNVIGHHHPSSFDMIRLLRCELVPPMNAAFFPPGLRGRTPLRHTPPDLRGF